MSDENKQVSSASDERTVNNVMRHEYRVLTENEKVDMRAIKDAGADFVRLLEAVASSRVGRRLDRELSISKTKIEEAVMWAVKSITG